MTLRPACLGNGVGYKRSGSGIWTQFPLAQTSLLAIALRLASLRLRMLGRVQFHSASQRVRYNEELSARPLAAPLPPGYETPKQPIQVEADAKDVGFEMQIG